LEHDHAFFYGRQKELDQLISLIAVSGFIVVHGASGVGKSSLLQAGVTPKLREQGYLPVLVRLSFGEGSPNYRSQVLISLAHALESAGSNKAANFPEHVPLWEIFHDPVYGLVKPTGNDLLAAVLLFDQFEELYTLGSRSERASGEFLEDLVALIENFPSPETKLRIQAEDRLAESLVFLAPSPKVILGLRSDFFAMLDREPFRRCALNRRSLEIREMTGLQAFDSVWRPASSSSILDRETAAAIVRFAAGVSSSTALEEIKVSPSNLTLCCEQLNQRRLVTGADKITIPDQTDQRHLFEDYYSRCFVDLPEAVRSFVEDELITPGGHRDSAAMERAISVLAAKGVDARRAIDSLIGARLLTLQSVQGTMRLELGHDALAAVARSARHSRREYEKAKSAMSKAKEEQEQEEALAHLKQMLSFTRRMLFLAILAILSLGAALIWVLSRR
jgi:hypothetical protein